MNHVISLLVENHQGVLSRIAGLFSGRGYNLESITAGPTADPTVTRITLVCGGDDTVIEQIKKQLHKLIDVIRLADLSDLPRVSRELLLVKVAAEAGNRGELFQVAEVFGARVMDVGSESIMAELVGDPSKLDDFLALLGDDRILEMARSGLVCMERGRKGKERRSGRAAERKTEQKKGAEDAD